MHWAGHQPHHQPTSVPIPPRRISSVGDANYYDPKPAYPTNQSQIQGQNFSQQRQRLNSSDNPRLKNAYLAPLPNNSNHNNNTNLNHNSANVNSISNHARAGHGGHKHSVSPRNLPSGHDQKLPGSYQQNENFHPGYHQRQTLRAEQRSPAKGVGGGAGAGAQRSIPQAFGQYYNAHPLPNYIYPTQISGIESCLEKLAVEGTRLSGSIKTEAYIFQSIGKNGSKLDNYFNGLPGSGTTVVFEAAKLQNIQMQQMSQIREGFVRSLRLKLTTPQDIELRNRQIALKIKEIDKVLSDRLKASKKPKLQPLKKSQLQADIDKYSSELNLLRVKLRHPPRIETRNEILGQSVKMVLYPASYDYILRTAKYSRIWEQEIDKHRAGLAAITENYRVAVASQPPPLLAAAGRLRAHTATSLHSISSSNIAGYFSSSAPKVTKPIADGTDRNLFRKEVADAIKEMERLTIVDKPD